MALDDRDRRFEQALARQLPVVCAEPETLAAYHDRLLSPEEMNAWKTHISGCARCQEILALLEATDDVVAETELEKNVMVAAAAPVRQMDLAAAQTKANVGSIKSRRQKARRGARSYSPWLAPAGAIAAGLLLWIVVQERKPSLPPPDAKVAIAQKEPAAEFRRDARNPAIGAAAAPSRRVAPSQQGTAIGQSEGDQLEGLAKQQGARADAAQQENGRLLDEVQSSPAQLPRQSRKTAALQPLEPSSLNEELRAGAQAKPRDNRSTDLKLEGREQNAMGALAPGVAAAPPPLPAAPAAAAATAPPQATPLASGGLVASEDKDKKDQAAISAMSESVEVTSAAPGGKFEIAKARVKKQENAHIVPAPGGNTVWSIGSGGVILRSTNGGKKWKQQPSGVDADLAAGSAATDAVCWIVGARGTILLTADGGNHWAKLPAPINADIGGVFAVDAVHAMIWDASNHQSFETDDGGRTWKPSATP